MTTIKKIKLESIIKREYTQARCREEESVILDYGEVMTKKPGTLPPVKVLNAIDDNGYYVIDGHHRVIAALRLGNDTIEAEIVDTGTMEDAIWLSAAANATNGLRRTYQDKRQAAEMALKLKPDMPNTSLADHCGVSDDLIASVRAEMEIAGTIPKRIKATEKARIAIDNPDNVGKSTRTIAQTEGISEASVRRAKSQSAISRPEPVKSTKAKTPDEKKLDKLADKMANKIAETAPAENTSATTSPSLPSEIADLVASWRGVYYKGNELATSSMETINKKYDDNDQLILSANCSATHLALQVCCILRRFTPGNRKEFTKLMRSLLEKLEPEQRTMYVGEDHEGGEKSEKADNSLMVVNIRRFPKNSQDPNDALVESISIID